MARYTAKTINQWVEKTSGIIDETVSQAIGDLGDRVLTTAPGKIKGPGRTPAPYGDIPVLTGEIAESFRAYYNGLRLGGPGAQWVAGALAAEHDGEVMFGFLADHALTLHYSDKLGGSEWVHEAADAWPSIAQAAVDRAKAQTGYINSMSGTKQRLSGVQVSVVRAVR